MTARTTLLLTILVLMAGAGCKPAVNNAGSPVGTSRPIPVSLTESGAFDPSTFLALTWNDVKPVMAAIPGDSDWLTGARAAASSGTNHPSLYLAGILSMALNDMPGALDLFRRLPPASIPAGLIYAPYRLQLTLHPGEINPFRDAMVQAAASGLVPALVQARVLATEGQLDGALEAYVKTDPAEWVSFDIDAIVMIHAMAGLTRETERMAAAALRARRLDPALAEALRTRLTSASAVSPEVIAGVLERLESDSTLRATAEAAAVKTVEIRRDFMQRDYAGLLERHRDANPVHATDEHVTIMVLSAAQQKDRDSFERWSRELRRRYPQNETVAWLKQLQNEFN